MQSSYRFLIIGTGSMGAAAAHYAAKDRHVLAIDALAPPHTAGMHHGSTRLYRTLYPDGAYQELLNRAGSLWQSLQAKSRAALFTKTGVLNFLPKDHENLGILTGSARRHNVVHDILSAAAVRKRFAAFQPPENYQALFEPQAGILHSETAVKTLIASAVSQGAATLFNRPVEHIELDSRGVTVHTGGQTVRADTALLSAGGWAHRIAGTGLALPYQTVRKTVAWYQAPKTAALSAGCPGFTAHTDAGIFYGFPDTGQGLKIGRHDGGDVMNNPAAQTPFTEKDADDTSAFLKRFMPDAGALITGQTCHYDRTADEDFIFTPHPAHPQLLIASGFSGHGFKFVPAVGALAASYANTQTLPDWCRAFTLPAVGTV